MVDRDKKRQAKPTPADIAASKIIRAKWDALRKRERLTQDDLADRWMLATSRSITQGAISQYLNGKLRIDASTAIRWAKVLGCKPAEIRPDLPELRHGSDPPDELIGDDRFAQKLRTMWPDLTDETKGQMVAFGLIHATTKPAAKKA